MEKEGSSVRRIVVIVVAAALGLAVSGHAAAAPSARIAALQVALRSHGLYAGAVDGMNGPLTRNALLTFQRNHRIRATAKLGMATRCKLGRLGTPLLGQRVLSRGRVGWDVASLEFRLRPYGLAAKRVDGRFDAATVAALRRFQRAHGLQGDGIAGTRTFRALAHPKQRTPARQKTRPSIRIHRVQPGEGFTQIAKRFGIGPAALAKANGLTLSSVIVPGQRLRVPGRLVASRKSSPPQPTPTATPSYHTVGTGESFFSIAQRYHVSPWRLAQASHLRLMSTIVPGQRLTLPSGAHLAASGPSVDRGTVRLAIDRWAAAYGVDPKLARALAWMESGFQEDVVSSAGAVGVMQLLPETWQWVDTVLLGDVTPRTYDGPVRAGVRYLRSSTTRSSTCR